MGGHNKFGVNLDALAEAEKGVRTAAGELSDMAGWGGGEVGAEGRGLNEGLTLSYEEVGHEGLMGALAGFGDAWEWGIRHLVDDGMDAADALGETRSTYEQTEDAVVSALKYGAHLFAGNPMESNTAWQDKSLGEINTEINPAARAFNAGTAAG